MKQAGGEVRFHITLKVLKSVRGGFIICFEKPATLMISFAEAASPCKEPKLETEQDSEVKLSFKVGGKMPSYQMKFCLKF